MIYIYHNPRCTKSRQGLALLEEKGLDFQVIKYLEQGLKTSEVKGLLKALDYTPIELIRKNEAIWKSDFKNKELDDDQIIHAMVEHPKLMERPIVIHHDKAVVGRPTEKILEII